MLKPAKLILNSFALMSCTALSAISFAATAVPQTIEKSSVIFLQGFSESQKERNELCLILQNSILDWSLSTVPRANCVDLKNKEELENIPELVKIYNAAFFINVVNDNTKSQYKLVISRLSPADSTEP